ncbi:N-acetyltransferase [Streptomyces antimycoticus]|uniref:N-acetyltransferase n=1 Tax=Streptomyces antimycoticus TaxID=68175 RepID=A0A499VD25_9ACTN|nr:GNAT family protein [Streptomyces antimycoticus]BBJ44057.1 N-acetyltransferase [Streptomyces antimycoticus]
MYPVLRDDARLSLRELTIDDVDAVLAIYGSPDATEHLSFTPRSRTEVGGIVARSIASASATPRDEYALAVAERGAGDGELVGYARLALDPHQQRAATIGFALRPDAWGVGYGRETVGLLLGLAFADLGLHRVWAARAPLNVASAKTLLAAGLTEEGRIRGHVHVRGAWRDSIVYGVLREEWEEQDGKPT